MRIFCGLTGEATTVAAAIVNERGGVIATSEVTDDALGYLSLCRMWVRHGEISHVTVADMTDTKALRRLASAAGQPTASTTSVDIASDDPLDMAVHIARMTARGELRARQGSQESEEVCQLVGGLQSLAANAHCGHAALIDLLRQTHPAALAAWGDPTETAALEVLRTSLGGEAVAASDLPHRAKPEPSRVKELGLALERTQRSRQYQVGPRVAASIAAAAESVLASERACLSLAAAVDERLTAAPAASTRRGRRSAGDQAATETRPSRRSRRSAGDQTGEKPTVAPPPSRRPTASEPLPSRQPVADTTDDEPVTAPLHPRSERLSAPGDGFPLMPEPPQFIEPAPPMPHSAQPDLLSAPVTDLPSGFDGADDDDLLIFSQARSAWFKGPAAIEDSEAAWNFPADEGWRAAEAASDNQRNASEITNSGLPRRVPQANLVPGSAILSESSPTPISRDATALASRTAGFFRGWSRARRETVGAGTGS